ncbi:MAG: alpha/beta hydrolase [Deltaproteobacteria bacterium]|nr:alpha/beta hydrolase [Deltaproteobacteria bacterium]
MPVPTFPTAAEAQHEVGQLFSRDGTRLHWERYLPQKPRAAVAVLPGGGDHLGRYPALTRGLVEAGLEVALLDFRGHGRSAGRRWHVDAFSRYHEDLDAFLVAVRERIGGRKLFVAAHSMGGLIAATWALAPGHAADGFVLSSPWFRPAVEPPRLKVAVGMLVGRVVPWLPIATGLRLEDLTSDEEMQAWTDEDALYGRKTTPRWFSEASEAQVGLFPRMREFRHPLLVLAGSADRIADPSAGEAFADQAGSADKEFKLYDGLRHELWNERDRARTVGDAVRWISARI